MEPTTERVSSQISISQVKDSLNESGYAILHFNEIEEAITFVERFGEIFNKEDIKIDKNKKGRLVSEHPMSLHTDHPFAKYVFWYCVSQSDVGG